MTDSDTVIRVENLGKCYKLGQTHLNRLSDLMVAGYGYAFRKLAAKITDGNSPKKLTPSDKENPPLNEPASFSKAKASSMAPSTLVDNTNIQMQGKKNEFWALRNVSFEVKRGDVVGLIGLNGAGKSTLFKLLSKITEPTEGRAWMKGRVGSLLEVGTGFHPELTGRENIFLNGAILGMARVEIKSKFDQIVEFAEIGQFLDTPVKRYSSGMYVRLAFAVAAHLEPEILLVDEVLAVGDAAFQHKCLGKMQEVTGEGRTIIFVSHTMPSVESLCNWTLVLDKGTIDFQGDTGEAVTHYLRNNALTSSHFINLQNHKGRTIHSKSLFQSLRLTNHLEQDTSIFKLGETIIFEVVLKPENGVVHSASIHIHIKDNRDTSICKLISNIMTGESFKISKTKVIRCHWLECRLVPGIYSVTLELKELRKNLDKINEALSFEIKPSDIYGTGKLEATAGLFVPSGRWELE